MKSLESSTPTRSRRYGTSTHAHNPRWRHSYDDLSRSHLEMVGENSVAACTLVHLCQTSGQAEQLDTMLQVFASSGSHLLHTAFHALHLEVAQTASEALLFRCDSFCTSFLGAILRRWGHKFLRRHVAPFIKRIDALPSVEIDPAALARCHPELEAAEPAARPALMESLLEGNRGRLAFIAHEFVEAMREAMDSLPPVLALVLVEVYTQVHALFPHAASRALGGVLFLRFIFPAFTLPDHHGLVRECSAALRRKLVMVAKLLQCIFNEAPRRDEDYFVPLTPFIAKHLDTNKVLYERLLLAVQTRPPGPLVLGLPPPAPREGASLGGSGSKILRKKRAGKTEPVNVMNLMALFVRYAPASAQYASSEALLQQVAAVWRRQAAVVGVELSGDVDARVQEESQQFLRWLQSEVGTRDLDHARGLRSLPNLRAPPVETELGLFQSLLNVAAGCWPTFQALLCPPGETQDVARGSFPSLNSSASCPTSPLASPLASPRAMVSAQQYGALALEALVPNLLRHVDSHPLREEDGALMALLDWSLPADEGPAQAASLLQCISSLSPQFLSRLYLHLCLWEVLLGPAPAPVPLESLGACGRLLGLTTEQVETYQHNVRALLYHRTTLLNALPAPESWVLLSNLQRQGAGVAPAPALEAMGGWDAQFWAVMADHQRYESGEELQWKKEHDELWRVVCGRLEVWVAGRLVGELRASDYWVDFEGALPSAGVTFRVREDTVLQRLSSPAREQLQCYQPALLARLFFAVSQHLVQANLHPQDVYLQRRMGGLIADRVGGDKGEEEEEEEGRVPVQVWFSDHTSQWFALAPHTTAKALCERVAQEVVRGVSCREKTFTRLYEQFDTPGSGEGQTELVSDQWTVQTIHTRAKYAHNHRLYFGRGAQEATLLSTAFVVAQAPCRLSKSKGTLFILPHHLVFQKTSSSAPDKDIELASLHSLKLRGEALLVFTHQDIRYKFTCSSEKDAERVRQAVCALHPMLQSMQCSVTRSATISKFALVKQAYQPLDATGLRVELAQTLKVLSSDGERLLTEDEQGQHGFVPARCLHLLSWEGMHPLQSQLIRDLAAHRSSRSPDAEGWRKILALARIRAMPAGQVVLARGLPFPYLGWVVEGRCDVLPGLGVPPRALESGQVVGYANLFLGFVPYDVISLGAQILLVDIPYLCALLAHESNQTLAAQFFHWAALQCHRCLQ